MPRIHPIGLLPLVVCGCALFAKETPTPAAQIDRAQLDQVQPPPGERYYGIVFGSESRPKVPRLTHSWATVVRVTDAGPGCRPAVDVQTISWLPVTIDFNPRDFYVQPGVNLDHHATLREVLARNEEVAMWGPYELSYPAYHRFTVQKQFLESGAVGYQTIDTVGEAGRTGRGCDCIHAITDLDPQFGRAGYPLAFYGQSASRHLVRRVMLGGVVIDPPVTHDWLVPELGLDRYPIERRTYRGRIVPYEGPGTQPALLIRLLPGRREP